MPTSIAAPETTTSAAPESTTSTTIDAIGEGEARALITPTGIVVPIRSTQFGSFTVGTPCANEATVSEGRAIGKVQVVIDPGHGGDAEPGAVGPTGLQEADVNLSVALLLEAELANRGISAVLTRTDDYRIAIRTRGELVQAIEPEVFLSVHHNASPRLDPWPLPATEIYYQHEVPDSQRFAELLYDELVRFAGAYDVEWVGSGDAGVRYRLNVEGEDLYGVLRRSEGIPAAISEAMYMSGAGEEELLRDPAVLAAEAQALANAVERYLTTDDEGWGYVGGDTFQPGQLGGSGGTDGCMDPELE